MSNISDYYSGERENTSEVFFYSPNNLTVFKDVTGWLSGRKRNDGTPNMTVLPVLAIIIFIVCVLLKVYKWYKDAERLRRRGDVEFGEESEVNYGIIKAGDKEFCNVEIRSDTTSVYDTVTSFRHIGNGHAVGGCCAHNYQDTVTSYKSLLMQRLDGTQYDSVKSYKAFLKQVTQNKDLAVEVKLLDNYPVRSKSVEHCVLEEESSEAIKLLASPGDAKAESGKKKTRHRRASGDVLGAMRKRSASNPTYNSSGSRTGANSLPSIHQTLSSDSSNEDDAFVTLASDRRKLWEIRKKMARSCSGGRLAKGSPSQLGETCYEGPYPGSRRRHFSADSARRPRKPLSALCHRADLNDLRESISETDPRAEEMMLLKKQEDSSSENPDSSPTSCNTSISSDAIESESEDEETQQITQLSVASDDHTVSCEGAFDSCGELASSAEHLLGPVKHSSESLDGTCSLPIDPEERNGEARSIPGSPVPFLTNPYLTASKSHSCDGDNGMLFLDTLPTPAAMGGLGLASVNHSTSHASSDTSIDEVNTLLNHRHHSPSPPQAANSSPVSSNPQSPSNTSLSARDTEGATSSQDAESPAGMASPKRVKRFHVTFVTSDVSSPNSD